MITRWFSQPASATRSPVPAPTAPPPAGTPNPGTADRRSAVRQGPAACRRPPHHSGLSVRGEEAGRVEISVGLLQADRHDLPGRRRQAARSERLSAGEEVTGETARGDSGCYYRIVMPGPRREARLRARRAGHSRRDRHLLRERIAQSSGTVEYRTDRYGAFASLIPAGTIPALFFPVESNCLR